MNKTADFGGVGRVCFWNGGSLWIGRDAGRSAAHDHHAIQITLALDPRRGFRLGAAARPLPDRRASIVMPHFRHEFDGCGGPVAHVFVEPESAEGRALKARFGDDIGGLSDPGLARALARLYAARAGDAALVAQARNLVARLTGELPPREINARVAAAIDLVARRAPGALSLDELAASVHLSPSRLRHLFIEETGSTYRAYVLWVRINHAVGAMMRGESWTQAAHQAGFADSAHLTRTFRRMFGIAPTMLVREPA